MDVDHGGFHKGVAKLLFDGQQMRSTMKQASRQTVSKQMRVYPLLQVCALCGGANQLAQVLLRIGLAAAQADEQPVVGPAAALA